MRGAETPPQVMLKGYEFIVQHKEMVAIILDLAIENLMGVQLFYEPLFHKILSGLYLTATEKQTIT